MSSENLFTEPDVPVRDHFDVYGNRFARPVPPPGLSTVHYAAWADVPGRVEDVGEGAPRT